MVVTQVKGRPELQRRLEDVGEEGLQLFRYMADDDYPTDIEFAASDCPPVSSSSSGSRSRGHEHETIVFRFGVSG